MSDTLPWRVPRQSGPCSDIGAEDAFRCPLSLQGDQWDPFRRFIGVPRYFSGELEVWASCCAGSIGPRCPRARVPAV